MAKKQKKTFKCDTCYVKLKSAMDSARHFKKYPTHRNQRQKIQFEYSQENRRRRLEGSEPTRASIHDVAAIGSLPTVQRRMQASRSVAKFCTGCGLARKISHRFCGGCGTKL
jgi:hypothetical protein